MTDTTFYINFNLIMNVLQNKPLKKTKTIQTMKKSLFTLVLMMLTLVLYSQESPSSFALSFKGGLQFPGPGQPSIGGMEPELKTSPFIKGD